MTKTTKRDRDIGQSLAKISKENLYQVKSNTKRRQGRTLAIASIDSLSGDIQKCIKRVKREQSEKEWREVFWEGVKRREGGEDWERTVTDNRNLSIGIYSKFNADRAIANCGLEEVTIHLAEICLALRIQKIAFWYEGKMSVLSCSIDSVPSEKIDVQILVYKKAQIGRNSPRKRESLLIRYAITTVLGERDDLKEFVQVHALGDNRVRKLVEKICSGQQSKSAY